jgi:hypothetical protein
MGIISLVFAIAGWLLFVFLASLPTAIVSLVLAFVFGIIAVVKGRTQRVLGVISLIASLGLVAFGWEVFLSLSAA